MDRSEPSTQKLWARALVAVAVIVSIPYVGTVIMVAAVFLSPSDESSSQLTGEEIQERFELHRELFAEVLSSLRQSTEPGLRIDPDSVHAGGKHYKLKWGAWREADDETGSVTLAEIERRIGLPEGSVSRAIRLCEECDVSSIRLGGSVECRSAEFVVGSPNLFADAKAIEYHDDAQPFWRVVRSVDDLTSHTCARLPEPGWFVANWGG